MDQKITLIVHKPFVMFHWGKSVFASFQKMKVKHGIEIKLIESIEDISETKFSGFVFLLGVDSKWIDFVIDKIKNPDLHIVLLYGESLKYGYDVSSIDFDQRDIIRKSIELLREKHRYKTAFFGVQENDTSDADKASVFALLNSPDNIYQTDGDIEDCFMRFYVRISEYDSVICANDIIAVYLCKRCREIGIDIPEQLYVIGNGGLWIADNTSPRLTTVVYDFESMADIALCAINSIVRLADLSTFNIKIKMQILDRESTGGVEKSKSCDALYYPQCKILYNDDPENTDENINRIKDIDSVFSSLSPLDKNIVSELIQMKTYEEISNRLFIAINTTRYHIKKIYKMLGIHTVQELRDLIDLYKIKM